MAKRARHRGARARAARLLGVDDELSLVLLRLVQAHAVELDLVCHLTLREQPVAVDVGERVDLQDPGGRANGGIMRCEGCRRRRRGEWHLTSV